MVGWQAEGRELERLGYPAGFVHQGVRGQLAVELVVELARAHPLVGEGVLADQVAVCPVRGPSPSWVRVFTCQGALPISATPSFAARGAGGRGAGGPLHPQSAGSSAALRGERLSQHRPQHRQTRPATGGIGTKNWLFAGHDIAAQRNATLYSLIASAERHGIDPQAYLRGVFARIPSMPVTQLEKLLPERWKTAEEPDLIDRWQSACLQDSTWI